jgi:hypothetical protein
MEPKIAADSITPGQDATLLPEIIAQAEAAVAGNAPKSQRRPSRQHDELHTTLSYEKNSLKSETHIHCRRFDELTDHKGKARHISKSHLPIAKGTTK